MGSTGNLMFGTPQQCILVSAITLNRLLFFLKCGRGYHVCDKVQKFLSLLKPLIILTSYCTLSVLRDKHVFLQMLL